MASWTFLTYHARVLLLVALRPGIRLRDIAASLNITERSAFGIITGRPPGRSSSSGGACPALVQDRRVQWHLRKGLQSSVSAPADSSAGAARPSRLARQA